MFFSKALWTTAVLMTAAKAQIPLAPSVDPFYTPPSGFASSAPGTILKNRKITASFLGLVPKLGVQAYQLLFRTTAINGTAIAGVTTVFKPADAAKDRFVQFHTAYDSAATICNPSYTYQLGSAQVNLITSVEMLLLQGYLLSGYIVSSPDYEGPDAAFPAGRLEGVVALDSMRAVSNFKTTLGLTTSTPKIVGYGYSGGSVASGWAASLQNGYAPELNISGWAMGGTVANLTGTLMYLDGTTFAGFLPVAINGLNKPSTYAAQLGAMYNSAPTPYGRSILNLANRVCGVQALFSFIGGRVLSTKFSSLGAGLPYNPTFKAVLDKCILGSSKDETPKKPVYMFHASQDEIIPYANATTLRDTWCADGASVKFVTYGNGGHITTEALGFVGAVQFTQAAFAGTAGGACTSTTTLNSTLDPLALGVSIEPVLAGLSNALLKLGQADTNLVANPATLNESVAT